MIFIIFHPFCIDNLKNKKNGTSFFAFWKVLITQSKQTLTKCLPYIFYFLNHLCLASCCGFFFFFINLFSVVDDDGGDEQSDSHWVILIDFCKYMTDAMRFLRSTTVDIKLFFYIIITSSKYRVFVINFSWQSTKRGHSPYSLSLV